MFLSTFRLSKFFLIREIVSPFSFSTLTAAIVSPQCLKEKSPKNKSNYSKSSSYSSRFTVSYLIDSCGLSPESAKYASKKVKLKSHKRPNSVLELFRNYGFDETHISRLVKGCPSLLLFNPEKTLLPKLQFLCSIGFSNHELATLLSYRPTILTRSLENRIIPIYESLKKVLGSDEKVVTFFKRTPLDFHISFLVPNVTALRKLIVPQSSVVLLGTNFPIVLLQRHDRFLEIVDKVKEMGFDPLKSNFVLAIQVLSGKGQKLIWDRCFKAYRKWGWSEDDILSAFKKHPHCMTLSEKKIDRAMDFFVNNMGYQSKVIVQVSDILLFSFEKRIFPRCSVGQVLISKGLIKTLSLYSILKPRQEIFLQRYVTRYEDESPHLMRVYRGEVVAS